MAYDGTSIWKENVLNDFKNRFLPFLHGSENIWLNKRIIHLRAEIERLRNTKNGLLQKLREASGKLTILSETASSVELNASNNSGELSNASPAKLSDKSYEGDFLWHYLQSPLVIPGSAKLPITDLTPPSKLFHDAKVIYYKSIQRWKENLEFKINKVRDLIDEYTREVEFLIRRKNPPTVSQNDQQQQQGSGSTEEQTILEDAEDAAIIVPWIEPNQGDPYGTASRTNRTPIQTQGQAG